MPLQDYNDATRMTRHQLAERIRQMEATAARNSQLGAPNDRHRPMEDNRRRDKIARYKAELARRELADRVNAAQAAAEEAAAAETARNQAQAQADARDKEQTTVGPFKGDWKSSQQAHQEREEAADRRAANRRDPLTGETPADRERRAAAARRPSHSRKPYRNDPEEQPKAKALTPLDHAIEKLVREYTTYAVLDATWAAAHRIFAPIGGSHR